MAVTGGDDDGVGIGDRGVGGQGAGDDARGGVDAQAGGQARGAVGQGVAGVGVGEARGGGEGDGSAVLAGLVGQRADGDGQVVGTGDGDDELSGVNVAMPVRDGVGEGVGGSDAQPQRIGAIGHVRIGAVGVEGEAAVGADQRGADAAGGAGAGFCTGAHGRDRQGIEVNVKVPPCGDCAAQDHAVGGRDGQLRILGDRSRVVCCHRSRVVIGDHPRAQHPAHDDRHGLVDLDGGVWRRRDRDREAAHSGRHVDRAIRVARDAIREGGGAAVVVGGSGPSADADRQGQHRGGRTGEGDRVDQGVGGRGALGDRVVTGAWSARLDGGHGGDAVVNVGTHGQAGTGLGRVKGVILRGDHFVEPVHAQAGLQAAAAGAAGSRRGVAGIDGHNHVFQRLAVRDSGHSRAVVLDLHDAVLRREDHVALADLVTHHQRARLSTRGADDGAAPDARDHALGQARRDIALDEVVGAEVGDGAGLRAHCRLGSGLGGHCGAGGAGCHVCLSMRRCGASRARFIFTRRRTRFARSIYVTVLPGSRNCSRITVSAKSDKGHRLAR